MVNILDMKEEILEFILNNEHYEYVFIYNQFGTIKIIGSNDEDKHSYNRVLNCFPNKIIKIINTRKDIEEQFLSNNITIL